MSPAAAQQGESVSDNQAIVVTAQFREQSVQDTPISITAISGDELAARSQTDTSQIAAQAPGVNLQPGTGSFGPSLGASIRGVGQYDFNPAVEPGVGFYVDDVYYPSLNGAIFDLLDLDRIEILRGPQGTLAGRNSIGGAIKIYSKRPQGDDSALVSATYGSRNKIGLRASLDVGLTPTLSARISGSSKQQDGYVDVLDFGCVNPAGSAQNSGPNNIPATTTTDDCRIARDGDINYQAVRGQLRFNPSSAVDLILAGEYVSDTRRPSANVLRATGPLAPAVLSAVQGDYTSIPFDDRFICGPYCNYSTGLMPADPANGFPFATTRDLETRYRGYGLSLLGEFELTDNLELTSITGYRSFRSQFGTDADLSPLHLEQAYSDLNVDFFSQEVRLSGAAASDRLHYTLGAFYSTQSTDYPYVQDLRSNGLQFASLGEQVEADSFALFGHVSFELADGLTLNGGIRRTRETKEYMFSRRYVDGSPGVPRVGNLDGLVGEYAETRWDYRANIQYNFTPDVMAYFQFSTGYKGGGINPRPFYDTQVQPFSPESINAWEVGVKSELFDVLRLNLSAFYNDYTDLQLSVNSCPQFTPDNAASPCNMTTNAGNAEVKGIELESRLQLFDGLTVDGTLSYLDFEYKSLNPLVSGIRITNVAPIMSKWKWSIGAQYEAELPGGSTLTPRFDLSYQSSFFSSPSNSLWSTVPAHTLLNGNLTWRNAEGSLDVSLQVTNITNEYYFLGAYDNLRAGFATAQPARPREWALAVTKRF